VSSDFTIKEKTPSDSFIGAFGSGATFALEDGWILARALELTQFAANPAREALEIFDHIRSPYYAKM
jgi:salicylate hydroxylase